MACVALSRPRRFHMGFVNCVPLTNNGANAALTQNSLFKKRRVSPANNRANASTPSRGMTKGVLLRAMETPLPLPPITRFDAVMWFLRVQLWISLSGVLISCLGSLFSFFAPFALRWGWLQTIGMAGVPVLILLLFPAVLASNALGSTSRQPVVSLLDLKLLIGRCLGLALFVTSLGPIVLLSVAITYELATRGTSTSLGAGAMRLIMLAQLVGPTISLFLGFALAFGPNIRDSLRAR